MQREGDGGKYLKCIWIAVRCHGGEFLHQIGRSCVWPYDCRGQRFAGFTIPDNCRFTLICHTESNDALKVIKRWNEVKEPKTIQQTKKCKFSVFENTDSLEKAWTHVSLEWSPVELSEVVELKPRFRDYFRLPFTHIRYCPVESLPYINTLR